MQARDLSRSRPLLAAVFVTAVIGSTGAQQPNLGVTSGVTAAPFRHQVGRRVTYICPATSASPTISVWGTNDYTFDSSVCLAAVHAGVLPLQQAGVVTFVMGPGAASFEGSRRNDVTSAGYGPYDSSFSFDRSGEPGRIDGFTTLRVPAGFTTPVTVVCPPLGTFPQPLWGTGTYADESSICAAAVHAGLIPLTVGGPVTVIPGGAQPSFAPSTQNSVRSQSYSAWPVSFTVAAVNAVPSGPGTRLIEAAPAPAQRGTVALAPVTAVPVAAPTGTALLSTALPRYLVTLPGLIVQRATKDDDLSRDGRGDEIVAAAVVVHWNRQTKLPLSRALVQTVEYGDLDTATKAPDRIQAGTRSGTGGLQAGDPVPRGFAPGAPSGAPQTTRFPLRVWEGTLTEGIDGVLVVPSIWERDHARTSFNMYREQWLVADTTRTLGVAAAVELLPGITATESTMSPGLPTLLTLSDLMAQIIDRPLGLTPAPLIAPYNNRFVVITREKLTALAAPGNSTEIAIDFAEPTTDPVLDGNYRLYLRVERLQ